MKLFFKTVANDSVLRIASWLWFDEIKLTSEEALNSSRENVEFYFNKFSELSNSGRRLVENKITNFDTQL